MALTKIASPIEYIEKSFLKKLLQDKDVTDISYNGECFYILSNEGGRKRVELKANPEQVNAFLRQLANLSERRWNYSDPILDVSFGRYRLNAVFPSLGRVHNRKRPTFSLRLESDFCRLDNDPGFFPEGAKDILYRALEQKEAIVIGGKTGVGKTELQKWLLLNMREATRVIVIDNVEELTMIENPRIDLTMWLSYSSNGTYENLLRNALRSNPDYIVLAEARGKEAYEALMAAMSGHPVITTIHSRQLSEMPYRLANMALKSHEGLNEEELRRAIKSHFRYYVSVISYLDNGHMKRKIEHIGYVNDDGYMEVWL